MSSTFFADFFAHLRGAKLPEVVSLDSVQCPALSALSLGAYLDWVYSGGGALPLPPPEGGAASARACAAGGSSSHQAVESAEAPAIQLLRLAAFLGNAVLVALLAGRLEGHLATLDEDEVLEVGWGPALR